jgi:hypothetical protein
MNHLKTGLRLYIRPLGGFVAPWTANRRTGFGSEKKLA